MEELIQFETAKLADEYGFNEGSYHLYTYPDGELKRFQALNYNTEQDGLQYEAPTQSVLQTWLRDVHKIHIIVAPTVTDYWTYGLCNVGNPNISLSGPIIYSGYDYVSYEEALEAGLKEALKLI